MSQLRIYNGNPCPVSIQNEELNIVYTIPSQSLYTNKYISVNETEHLEFILRGKCIVPSREMFMLEESKAISFYLNDKNISRFVENVDKSKSGLPVVR